MTLRINSQTSSLARLGSPALAVTAICNKVAVLIERSFRGLADLVSKVHFFFHSYFYETIDPSASLFLLHKAYFGLAAEKWKECIDGKYHHLGKDVFKFGLHQGVKEPEYVPSMEKSYQFVAKYLNKKVDADFYLQLHRFTCGHFDGDPAVYLMGQERLASSADRTTTCSGGRAGFTASTPVRIWSCSRWMPKLKKRLDPLTGWERSRWIVILDASSTAIKQCPAARLRRSFNKFMKDFYAEIEKAGTPDQKLTAIARLNKRLELLHPPRDGSGRTNTALINKILTEYGFHPAILDQPFVSTSYPLNRWTEYLKEGLKKWEAERAKLSP